MHNRFFATFVDAHRALAISTGTHHHPMKHYGSEYRRTWLHGDMERGLRSHDRRTSQLVDPKEISIKIALIDNGVDAWQPAIANNVRGGFSYDREGPWYRPDDAHGTHMASIIRNINPFHELYVYRVTTYGSGLVLDNAAKVII
jgi:hypothetical protein